MCGRFVAATPLAVLEAHFGAVATDPALAERHPSWNVAPGSSAPVVLADAGTRALVALRWGLVPSWARNPSIGNRLINARSETASTTPAFRSSFARRRCLVPVDGFYEWAPPSESAPPRRELPGGPSVGAPRARRAKQPWYFCAADGEPLALGGLWDRWRDGAGASVATFTILTTAANAVVAPVHDRMPVVMPKDHWAAWLGETDDPTPPDPAELRAAAAGFGPETLRAWPVGLEVNRPGSDGPALVEPLVATS